MYASVCVLCVVCVCRVGMWHVCASVCAVYMGHVHTVCVCVMSEVCMCACTPVGQYGYASERVGCVCVFCVWAG